MLAYQMFISDFNYSLFLIISTYYAAQFFLAYSVVSRSKELDENVISCCFCCGTSDKKVK